MACGPGTPDAGSSAGGSVADDVGGSTADTSGGGAPSTGGTTSTGGAATGGSSPDTSGGTTGNTGGTDAAAGGAGGTSDASGGDTSTGGTSNPDLVRVDAFCDGYCAAVASVPDCSGYATCDANCYDKWAAYYRACPNETMALVSCIETTPGSLDWHCEGDQAVAADDSCEAFVGPIEDCY